tara:strand:- start:526 stop:765 length:240 start_codon:yes stop_codon:yes gene_type:complete
MREKRYTATYTIYLHARDDNHARSKAKLIAERERAKYPNQDCALEQLFETPFASFVSRAVPLDPLPDNIVDGLEDDLPF